MMELKTDFEIVSIVLRFCLAGNEAPSYANWSLPSTPTIIGQKKWKNPPTLLSTDCQDDYPPESK
jgi:hypothetical protein